MKKPHKAHNSLMDYQTSVGVTKTKTQRELSEPLKEWLLNQIDDIEKNLEKRQPSIFLIPQMRRPKYVAVKYWDDPMFSKIGTKPNFGGWWSEINNTDECEDIPSINIPYCGLFIAHNLLIVGMNSKWKTEKVVEFVASETSKRRQHIFEQKIYGLAA